MNDYNYYDKIKHRNNLITNMNNNLQNTEKLTIKEWYYKYMPFLPKEVLEILPKLDEEKRKLLESEEVLKDLRYLFN
jgi:hypothetical protein